MLILGSRRGAHPAGALCYVVNLLLGGYILISMAASSNVSVGFIV